MRQEHMQTERKKIQFFLETWNGLKAEVIMAKL